MTPTQISEDIRNKLTPFWNLSAMCANEADGQYTKEQAATCEDNKKIILDQIDAIASIAEDKVNIAMEFAIWIRSEGWAGGLSWYNPNTRKFANTNELYKTWQKLKTETQTS